MAEEQGRHRREMESKAADYEFSKMRRKSWEKVLGQICALVVTLSFIGSGVYLATHGQPWPGAVLGGGVVGLQALVATFIRGRQRESKEKPVEPQKILKKK
jgi:uncharacterized membrane protein